MPHHLLNLRHRPIWISRMLRFGDVVDGQIEIFEDDRADERLFAIGFGWVEKTELRSSASSKQLHLDRDVFLRLLSFAGKVIEPFKSDDAAPTVLHQNDVVVDLFAYVFLVSSQR